LKEIGVERGQTVLDFGCGAGHYTIPGARAVGRKGKAYAVDKDRGVLGQLTRKAVSEGLTNIIPIAGEPGMLKSTLKDNSVDVMLLYDVLHYMDLKERRRVYVCAYRMLRAGGMLSVYPKHCRSDEPLWNLSDLGLEEVTEEIRNARFELERESLMRLIHDESFNMGHVLTFRKRKEG